MGGLNVVGYHLVNNLIHALTALVLFGVVRRTLRTERLAPIFGNAADGVGFAVALLWALHPLDTESVTYVIQRSESLAGLFAVLTLYCVIRGATAERAIGWELCGRACLRAGCGIETGGDDRSCVGAGVRLDIPRGDDVEAMAQALAAIRRAGGQLVVGRRLPLCRQNGMDGQRGRGVGQPRDPMA